MQLNQHKVKYSFILFIFFFSLVNGKEKKSNTGNPSWQLIDSPTKTTLNYVNIFSDNYGLIIGDKILESDGSKWSFAKYSPTIEKIDRFTVLNKDDYWISTLTIFNQSDLYHYKNSKWTKIVSPLANQITAMNFLSNGTGWVGGVGEIAFYNGKTWKYFSSPLPEESISNIYGDESGKVWVHVYSKYLFFYDGKSWHRIFPEKKIHSTNFTTMNDGWLLADNELYIIKNGVPKFHSGDNLLYKMASVSIIDENNIWAAGAEGIILHYSNGKWEKTITNTNAYLSAINMQNKDEGWAVGARGIILCYNKNKIVANEKSPGFDQKKIYLYGREVNDEYGVAIDDFNKDGRKDIYAVCIFDPNRLYINGIKNLTGSPSPENIIFLEEATSREVTGVLSNSTANPDLYLGVTSGDIDNDGDPDLYLCNLIRDNQMFLNDGSGYFWNVSGQRNRGQCTNARSNAAILGDVDNDGDPDLFVTNEYSSNKLFLNDGNGYLSDVSDDAGLKTELGGMGASFGDIDNDGDLDLYVANWYRKNLLFRNEFSQTGKVQFTDISKTAGVEGESFAKSNAVVFADIDNDADLDLFVTNRKISNRLYINNGKGIFDDKTEEMIGLDSMLSYGASFADFDNDGFLDLFVANIYEDKFYKNITGKKFIDVSSEFGATLGGYSTGTATGDIDNDGDIDIYLANYINANSTLLLNNLNDKRYILINVEGTKSNRDAVGAKIFLYKGGHSGDNNYLLGFREINGGSGYASINSKEVHFGLPDGEYFDIRIYFPASGTEKTIRNIKAGSRIFISEENGFERYRTLALKSANRFIINPQTHFEAFKLFIAAVMIFISNLMAVKKYNWQNRRRTVFYLIGVLIYFVLSLLFRHESFFLSSTLPILSLLFYLLILHLIYERITLIKKAKIEKQETRDRIARDLHDDLASTISSAYIYSETLSRTLNREDNKQAELSGKISMLLSEASESITDIVWTVSPYQDNLEDMVTKLKSFIADSCHAKGIQCTFTFNEIQKQIALNQETRKNIYLILKEATNNLIRHSKAKNVMFKIRPDGNNLIFTIEDDGAGMSSTDKIIIDSALTQTFSLTNVSFGNGIFNMIKRAKEINAGLLISSEPAKGTRIVLSIEK